MPKARKNAVAARKSRESVRPVWCERGAETWAPRYSGATSWPVQRWMCWRAIASVMSDVQNRCTRSTTPRSIRPPPPAQDSQRHVGVPGAQVVEQGVERGVLARAPPGAPPYTRAAGLEQVAVVVPLDVVDGVLGQDLVDPVPQVVPHVGVGQVQHVLVAVLQRLPPLGGEDPVGVLAVEVGVGVDHLRLEPQPELHAEAVHVVDEPSEPVRPHRLVDPPVAEAGGVVAAAEEPPVVQDEPLHADLRREVGEPLEPVGVVVEVHRLPHVERHRLLLRVGGKRALPGVQRLRRRVQPRARRDEVDPRHRVAVALEQHDLAGQQQLAGAEGRLGRRAPLDAPSRSCRCGRRTRPCTSPVAKPKPAVPGDQHARGVVTGLAAARLAQPQAVGDPVPLRGPLPLVAAGEVEDLRSPRPAAAASPRAPPAGTARPRRWSGRAGPAAPRRGATRSPCAARDRRSRPRAVDDQRALGLLGCRPARSAVVQARPATSRAPPGAVGQPVPAQPRPLVGAVRLLDEGRDAPARAEQPDEAVGRVELGPRHAGPADDRQPVRRAWWSSIEPVG